MAVQQTGQPPAPRQALDDRRLSELWSRMTTDVGDLVKKETELAKAEISEQVGHVSKASAMFGATALVGLLALLLLSLAAAWGLAEVMPTGLAFAIVGVVYGLVALALLAKGRGHLERFQPLPKQTLETLKQDISVAKDSLKRGMVR